MADGAIDPLEAMNTYIDGKMKRYTLLFAVNGGAFAIAQLAPEVLNSLSRGHLAAGAILFTVLMYADIWAFGTMMRDRFIPELAFKRAGQAILILMATLLIGAWSLALSQDLRLCALAFTAGIAGLLVARAWVDREARRAG